MTRPKLNPEYVRQVVMLTVHETPGATVHGVRSMSTAHPNVRARWMAWRQIVEETNCGYGELANLFGCGVKAIGVAVGVRPNPTFDPVKGLKSRLQWQRGSDAAADILNGRDPSTQADIARWNALGRKDAA